MRQGECGQVTVFLGLVLISFWMVCSICIEGIYVRMKSAEIIEQQMASAEYAQANFHKELWEQFHLFGIDGRYASKMDASLKKNWKDNMGTEVDLMTTDHIDLTQAEGKILRHQIREYMKYAESTKLLDQLKQLLKGVEDDAQTESMKGQVDKITQAEEGETEAEEDVEAKAEDPRKALKKLLSGDILSLVLPAGKTPSEKEVEIQYGKKGSRKENKPDFFKKESVSDLLDQEDKGSISNQIASEGLTAAYAADVFRTAVDPESKKGLCYEMEYLIAGKEEERDNLKSVVNRLLAVRFALNYAYLLSSSDKQAQAYALAAAITSVASAIPAVVEGVKMLLLAAWAYGEAVIDVRSLLKGNKIPLKKDSATWQLQLENLSSLTAGEKTQSNGISYKGYLQLLLLAAVDKDNTYKRMMDVIQQRIRETQSDFSLQECIFSFQMNVSATIRSIFYPKDYEVENHRVFVY